jgi:hypothetical protein
MHIGKIKGKVRTKEEEKERNALQDTMRHEMLNVATTQVFTWSSYYAISTNCINYMYTGEIVTVSSHESSGRVLMKFDIRSLYSK